MKIGLISYDKEHLKTEQLVTRYVRDCRVKEIKIFAMPFKPRSRRNVIFSHRPDMSSGLPSKKIAPSFTIYTLSTIFNVSLTL